MKYLYHASFTEGPGMHHFVPRIPDGINTDYEDASIPRICFSDSILKCISAIGSGSRDLRQGGHVTVYRMPFPTSDFVTPEELYGKHLVYDALENHEYWYLKPIDLVGTSYQIGKFDYEHAIGFTAIPRDKLLQILKTHAAKCVIINEDIQDNKKLYESVTKQLWDTKHFSELDAIDDELAEIECAQRIEIHSLTLIDPITGEKQFLTDGVYQRDFPERIEF